MTQAVYGPFSRDWSLVSPDTLPIYYSCSLIVSSCADLRGAVIRLVHGSVQC